MLVPPAPWVLTGQVVAFVEGLGARLMVNYEGSPVGPYLEWAWATLPGPTVKEMLVTSALSRQGGREIWGFPKELAPLSWKNDQTRVVLRTPGKIRRFRAFGPIFPLRLAFWTIQTLEGQKVRVLGKITGRAQFVWRGRQIGLWLREFEMRIDPPQALAK